MRMVMESTSLCLELLLQDFFTFSLLLVVLISGMIDLDINVSLNCINL